MSNTKLTKDVANKTMIVERKFNAPQSKVWAAWTDSSILEKWWAPKPWKAETGSFDFSEGGGWKYAMVGPEGEKHWAVIEYETIDPENSFTATDAFSDENGIINSDMPQMKWFTEFKDEGEATTVVVNITFATKEDMQKIIEMGFEEGFKMGLDNLDEVLAENK